MRGIGSRRGAALLLFAFAFSCNRCARRNAPRLHPDAEAAIRSEARAFYRDLASRDAPALLNHFWPAKIAARWDPPFDTPTARPPRLLSAAILPTARGAVPESCAPADAAAARAELHVEGSWARAVVPRCPEGNDEIWFLEFDKSWKIVRLALVRDG